MRHLIQTLVILLAFGATAAAQHGVVHIVLNDSSKVSGFIVELRNDSITIQEDIKRFEDGLKTVADSLALWEDSRTIALESIVECELERSSIAFPILFPGLPIATTLCIGDVDSFAEIGAITMAVLVGGVVAIIVHGASGYDPDIDVKNPDDIETLKEYALFQNVKPAMLQELH
jgi:hypothetical protein